MSASLLLAGCGSFQPFATPSVARPALPRSEPFPAPQADEGAERLEIVGFACSYDAATDIPPSWICMRGDQPGGEWIQVSLFSEHESGPIAGVFVDLFHQEESKDKFDRYAAGVFHEVVVHALLENRITVTKEDLTAMIAANWPVELNDGWMVGFDRSSADRRMHVAYRAPSEE